MDSYEIDAIKIEKAKAMHRYRAFQKIATIVKILEIFVAAVVISWSILRSSEYLPAAVEFFSAFLRRAFSLLFCPHFVFLVGNVIIITLLAYSREKAPGGDVSFQKPSGEFFSGELQVKDRESEVFKITGDLQVEERESEAFKVAVDFPAAPTESAVARIVDKSELEFKPPVVEKIIREVERKTYRRTKSVSEKVIGEEEKLEKIELRRSKTVPRRKSRNGESAMATSTWKRMYDVEDLSNEEFRKRVEAFIEKQQKFLREESKAVVLTTSQ